MTPRKHTTMRLRPKLLGELTALAKAEGVSRSNLVERILTQFCDQAMAKIRADLFRKGA